MSDVISVACPTCKTPVELPREYLGSKVACPTCEARFVVGEDLHAKLWEVPKESSESVAVKKSKKSHKWLFILTAISLVGGATCFFWKSISSQYSGIYETADKGGRPVPRGQMVVKDYAAFLTQVNAGDNLALARQKTVATLDADYLNAVVDPDMKKLLGAFFASQEWMEEFWSSPVKNPRKALETLMQIACFDKRGWFLTKPLWRRFGIAVAVNDAGSDYDKVMLYRAFQDAYEKELLHPSFDTLAVWEMRYLTDLNKLDVGSVPYLLEKHHTQRGRYGGSCWYVSYMLHNFFGDSIHGPLYYRPWDHVYQGRYERIRLVGGVCGSLSHYGSAVTKVHGIPSTPGGQPGHCAYMSRESEGRWQIHYNVGAWTGPHFSLFDLWYFSSLDMIEDMYRSPAARLEACRLLWKAEALERTRYPKPKFKALTADLYQGSWNRLPDFAKLTAQATFTNKPVGLDFGTLPETFAVRWRGKLEVPSSAPVIFKLASDDGSKLFVNSQLVIDNDGPHGMDPKTGTQVLGAGTYPLELHYFQMGGAKGLDLTVSTATPYDPEIHGLYKDATVKNSGDYEAWTSLANYLNRCTNTPYPAWTEFGTGVARSFVDHQQVAWQLLHTFYLQQVQKQQPDKVLATLQKVHRQMPQSKRPTAELFNFRDVLNQQATLLGNNPQQCLDLFSTLMDVNFGNGYFGHIMQWGSEKFIKDEKFSAPYIQIIGAVAKTKDSKGLGGFLGSAIREAAMAGNIATFQQLSDLNDQFVPIPEEQKKEKQMFTAPLLSHKGLLQTSSTSGWENPANYRQVIGEWATTGNFHTGNETAPWAKVVLPGMAEITGVYLENVYTQNNARQVPIEVWVSEDDQKWTKVFESEQANNEWKVDLSDKPVRAKYVKACRTAGNRSEFFHLRKIQVYGKKLY
jgi:hypothetical protein